VSRSRDFVIDSARSSFSNRSANMLFVISKTECRDSVSDSGLQHKRAVILADEHFRGTGRAQAEKKLLVILIVK
jgi:uncharacterized membrane protein